MRRFGIKEVTQGYFYKTSTGEVAFTFGYKEEIHKEASRLIRLRDRAKRKRTRQKLNKRILELLKS